MLLNMKDKTKIEILQHVLADEITTADAARLLGRSERTVYRLCQRFTQKGLDGVVHGGRGKISPRRTPESLRERILTLVGGEYAHINDTHLAELLASREGIKIGRETLRQILRASGIAAKRRRRSPKYRSRRERKEAMGMMLQIDGSPHDWLEGRGPSMTLVGAKDDATGYTWAQFHPSETTWSYLELLEEIILSHGLPLSLYSDRHTIFYSPREQTVLEQIKNEPVRTQFGRAMETLDIRLIKAWSPQAKGRIEREWGFLQDRLVTHLRLEKVSTMEDANRVLKVILADFNKRFIVAPQFTSPVFRKAPPREELERILCIHDQRVVSKDHTISFEGLTLQIPPSKHFHSLAKRKVDVLQLRDGRIQILHQQQIVAEFRLASVTRMIDVLQLDHIDLRKAA